MLLTLFLITACGGGGSNAPQALETDQDAPYIKITSLERTTGTTARLIFTIGPEGCEGWADWRFYDGPGAVFIIRLPISAPAGDYQIDVDPGIAWNSVWCSVKNTVPGYDLIFKEIYAK